MLKLRKMHKLHKMCKELAQTPNYIRMRKHTMRDCLSAQEVEPEWAAHYTRTTHTYSTDWLSAVKCLLQVFVVQGN